MGARMDPDPENPDSVGPYRRLFEAMFDQSSVGMAHVGLNGELLRVNEALAEMLGYTQEELVSMSFPDITHPEDLEWDQDNLKDLLQGNISSYSMEKRYIGKHDQVVWGRLTVSLARDSNGQADFFVGIVEDVTERVYAERESERLSTIVNVQQEIAETALELEPTIRKVADVAREVTGAGGAVVALQDGEDLVFRATSGSGESFLDHRMPVESSLFGWVFEQGRPLVCADVDSEERVERPEELQELGMRSGILVPLSYKNKTFGLLAVISPDPYFFEDDDLATIQLISGLLASQIFHSLQYRDTLIESETDSLTGIHNRRKLLEKLREELERVDRYERALSVIMFDIDRFKLINDSHGHVVGDRVLERLGDLLEKETRATDVVGRYGGEEFLIVLPETRAEEALELADRIRSQTAELEFEGAQGEPFRVTISGGVSSVPETLSLEQVIDRVDQALYRAKQNGRNTVECYPDDLT